MKETTTVTTVTTTTRRKVVPVPKPKLRLVKRVRTVTVHTPVAKGPKVKTVRAIEVKTTAPYTELRTPSGRIVRVPAGDVVVRTRRPD